MFKELEKKKAYEVEEGYIKYWKDHDILNKSIENKDKTFVFYDGPIYANAKPGIHHVLAKTIKDAFCKYKSMNGYKVLRKIGLDTHGLPIEVNVEKKLGFKSKSDIEEYGIENFCKECNKATALNIDEVNLLTDKMGQFIDSTNPYITCSNEYIESEWWLLKQIADKNLIYHGNKVLPYCPRCGTELSANEVSQGYQEDSVNTVIVPFKIKDEDTYFLVWTTTPWTLLANVALCVNPNLEYIKVLSKGYKFILSKSLADKVLKEEYEILETYKGSDLAGIKYEQLLPYVKVEGKSFEVLTDPYVTAEDGTGIVHIAPAYGEDDNRVCKQNNIATINPVDKEGRYATGPWQGRLVTDKELEIDIIKYLKEQDKLFQKIKITHDYPHCWRCHSPLIYYSKDAWYIKTTEYKDKIISCNKQINWYPEYVGTKRFNNWLENMVDWGISRNRYWGCPMPIWICKDCNHTHVIGSLDELQQMVKEEIDVRKIELHRPYIDEIHLKCPHCSGTMERVKDVLDVWFDSGAMPYAQYHYPFENKSLFENQFPADFIAEGIDQTRGWFNSLICISTIVSGTSSFKNVVVNDMVLDANGKKMSKSTGNIIDPIKTIDTYGADTLRWYMLYASPVWTPLKFDEEGLKEVHSKFLNPLKNTYTFFAMYANIDKIDPRTYEIDYNDLEEIDKWMLSKFNRLIKNVNNAYTEYDLNKVTKYITEFTSDDLSNWYIRRNRKRFWGSTLDNSKKGVYYTTYKVLLDLSKLIAPITPFISEEIYQNLTDKESVHLSSFPTYDDNLINEQLENKMDLVRNIISLGRSAREDAKIKVRQPIKEIILDGKNEEILKDVEELIKEELNVKKLTFTKDLSAYMNFTVKPNFKNAGSVLGSKMKDFVNYLNNLDENTITDIRNNKDIYFDNIKIDASLLDIKFNAKEGFDVTMENNNFVILNTYLDEDLLDEGLAREFISKIQNLRKTSGFDVENRINIYITANEEFLNRLNKNIEYVKKETLCINLINTPNNKEILEINDYTITCTLEIVNK